jgi:hypothetical protein
MGEPGKMHDRIHTLQARHPVTEGLDLPIIRDFPTHRQLGVLALRNGCISHGSYDIEPGSSKLVAQVAPNKSGRPGYKDAHRFSTILS